MIALLLALFAGASAPAGVDLDDPVRWEKLARRAVGGPASRCYDLSGSATVTVRLYQPATLYSRATSITIVQSGRFDGRLDKGTWTAFLADLMMDGEPADSDLLLGPLLGTIPAGVVRAVADGPPKPEDTDAPSVSVGISSEGVSVESAGVAARNSLAEAVSGTWTEEPSTLYVQWNEARRAVEMVIETPLDAERPNVLSTAIVAFPEGRSVPVAIDIQLPRKVRVGDGLLKATVMSAQGHVRGQVVDGELLPTLESVSGAIGVLGMTLAYEQRLVYDRAQQCP